MHNEMTNEFYNAIKNTGAFEEMSGSYVDGTIQIIEVNYWGDTQQVLNIAQNALAELLLPGQRVDVECEDFEIYYITITL